MYRTCLTLIIAGWVVCAGATVPAGQPLESRSERDEAEFFEEYIRPLLSERCYKCHGARQQENGLRLDSREAMLTGGDSGPGLVPGDPDDSLLMSAVRHESFEMPPDDRLSDQEIGRLADWIKHGAKWPSTGAGRTTRSAGQITDEDRAFWSFQPVRDPAVPVIQDDHWSRTGIDKFILRKLQREEITVAEQADRRTLVRRVYADLLGLPPTPEAVDAFVSDDSSDAWERLVEQLLASPAYGERWGRRWLDLVRYAESNGHGSDQYRPTAWRYRDYVIQAFNEDKPYDQFVIEQLAADEVAPDDPDVWVATGFLRHWIYESNQRQVRLVRDVILTDVTDVTADVFLGLGFGCARCHDHKFDPILQEDYFRFRSFFAAMTPHDDIPLATSDRLEQFNRQLQRWEDATTELRHQLAMVERPAVEAQYQRDFGMFPQDIKDMHRKPAELRSPIEQALVGLMQLQLDAGGRNAPKSRLKDDAKATWEELRNKLEAHPEPAPEPLPYAMLVTDIGAVAPITTLPGKQQPLDPAFPSVLAPDPAQIIPSGGTRPSTGRRTALARWVASNDNPLTARVIVNRVWQYHFGRGLVGTSSDFGQLGDRPTHPELLDWLTSRFLESGWRIKSVHREILNSATYRQTAVRPTPENAVTKDAGNQLLWRMNIRRLEAEPIRDAMLAVTGELDRTVGGPSVDMDQPRRTVYLKVVRNTPEPLMRAFDAPDGFISTAQRDQTTTPAQALMLMNGDWSLQRADALAARLRRELPDAGFHDRVDRAFLLCFGRSPEGDELRRMEAFRDRVARSDPRGSTDRALAAICHVLLNANEFIYID